jgi:hypothetical protein
MLPYRTSSATASTSTSTSSFGSLALATNNLGQIHHNLGGGGPKNLIPSAGETTRLTEWPRRVAVAWL